MLTQPYETRTLATTSLIERKRLPPRWEKRKQVASVEMIKWMLEESLVQFGGELVRTNILNFHRHEPGTAFGQHVYACSCELARIDGQQKAISPEFPDKLDHLPSVHLEKFTNRMIQT